MEVATNRNAVMLENQSIEFGMENYFHERTRGFGSREESGFTGHSVCWEHLTSFNFLNLRCINFVLFGFGVVLGYATEEKLAFTALVLLLLPCVLLLSSGFVLLGHVQLYSQADRDGQALVVTSEESCMYCNIASKLDMVNRLEQCRSFFPTVIF